MRQVSPDDAYAVISRTICSGSGGMELMDRICREAGPRPTGSAGIAEARRILTEEWRRCGIARIGQESFPVLAWREGRADVELLEPAKTSYQGLQCVHTGSGEVRSFLIDAGPGAPSPQGLRGAVAVVPGHEISGGVYVPFQKRVLQLQEAGVKAVLLASSNRDLAAVEFFKPELHMAIPVVAVSGKDAEELRRFAKEGRATVSVATSGRAHEATCANLVGVMGPDAADSDVIVVSAHLDSYFNSPGAFDNLTGIVVLSEIARAIAPYQSLFTRELRLIAFTGEEYGHMGSLHYVKQHDGELNRIRFDINLDSLFDSTACGIAVMWSPSMRHYIEKTLRARNQRVDVRDHFCLSSDYFSFMGRGIPAARPADWHDSFPPYNHTNEDTPEKLSVEPLKANALLLAPLLLRILTDPEDLPVARKDPAEVQALLEQHGDDLKFFHTGRTEASLPEETRTCRFT